MTHRIDTGFLVAGEVAEHPDHQAARQKFQSFRAAGDRFALVPQVLAEFVHVVTDPKRFTLPLTMEQALERAELFCEKITNSTKKQTCALGRWRKYSVAVTQSCRLPSVINFSAG